LNLNHKTGMLQATTKGHTAAIYFDKGEIVWAQSSDPRHSPPCDQTVVPDGQRRDALKRNVAEIIFNCYPWSDGGFTFESDARPPVGAVTISLEIGNLLMEGARHIAEWEECQQLFPDAGVVLRAVAAPNPRNDVTLTPREWSLLAQVDGRRALGQLAGDESPLDVYRVLHGLLANRLIEIVPPRPMNLDDTSGFIEPTMQRDTTLLVSPEATLSLRATLERDIAFLVSEQGRTHPLSQREYRIGRWNDNEIVVVDSRISGLHARLYRTPDGYVLEDLGSKNGTMVNGVRIKSRLLASDDRVHIGDTVFVFRVVLTEALPQAQEVTDVD
jgi:hypothetical protein